MTDFPIIDIGDVDRPDAQLAIAQQITEASRTWGFLLLKNHSISDADIDEMFGLGRKFFVDMPEDEKTPWPVNSEYTGYNGPLSDAKKDDKASMWFSGRPGYLNHTALPPYWHRYTDKIDAFKHNCHDVIMKLLVCFALAMDLPDRNFFANAHMEDAGQGTSFRMVYYPARGNGPSHNTTRMSSHSDSGSVTLLFQTCSGLEVESPTGEWVPAPYLPGHIVVNLGDALAFWSGGHLKATKHRVTFDGVLHDRERMTMAYFGKASPETVLQPLKPGGDVSQLVNYVGAYEANGVKIMPGITVREYSEIIMKSIYGVGPASTRTREGVQTQEMTA